jgi:hypothetical protein
VRVAKKSVKGAPNLQDLLCLTIFIYIIYLHAILLQFRLLGLKSIYLLREHHTKSVAESSYSLLRDREICKKKSLSGSIPVSIDCKWQGDGVVVPSVAFVDVRLLEALIGLRLY